MKRRLVKVKLYATNTTNVTTTSLFAQSSRARVITIQQARCETRDARLGVVVLSDLSDRNIHNNNNKEGRERRRRRLTTNETDNYLHREKTTGSRRWDDEHAHGTRQTEQRE